jgi:A/G-specific adenine glycosylase
MKKRHIPKPGIYIVRVNKKMTPAQFRTLVWGFYKEHGRSELPWRKTTDPYKILVSEMMLQQTQVERVIPYYKAFIKKFPTARALSRTPLSDVLKLWQGLGYNRRAKFLHHAAHEIVVDYAGKIPEDAAILESIWGIGPYTAHAVMTFAFNHDAVFIETNIRTVILHHFFHDRTDVSDEDIANILKKVLPRGKAHDWYSALMDYGAHLKRSGIRLNAKAKGYTKQSTFAGSARQARGAILKELTKGRASHARLTGLLGDARKDQLTLLLTKLEREGMIKKARNSYVLP